MNPNMNFSEALDDLKKFRKVAREGWNGKGMWLYLVTPDDFRSFPANVFDSFALLEYDLEPFIAMKTADDKIVPWLASQTDLLAEDWRLVE